MKKIVFFIGTILVFALPHAHAINTGDPERDVQINSDPRQLHLKKWVHGPAVDTLENYELNLSIWHAQVESLRVHCNLPFQDENFLTRLLIANENLKKWKDTYPGLVGPISDFLTSYAQAYVRNPEGNDGWWLMPSKVPAHSGYFFNFQMTGTKGQNLPERDIAAWLTILSSSRVTIHCELRPSFFSDNPYFDDLCDQPHAYVTKRFFQDLAVFKLISCQMHSNFDFTLFEKIIGKNIDHAFKEALVVLNNQLLPLEDQRHDWWEGKCKNFIFFCAAYLKHKLDHHLPGYLGAVDVKAVVNYMFSLIDSCSKQIQLEIFSAFCSFLKSKGPSYYSNHKIVASLYDYVITHEQSIPAHFYVGAADHFLEYMGCRTKWHSLGDAYIPYHIKARECYEKAIELYGHYVPHDCLSKACHAYLNFGDDAVESTENKIKNLERALVLKNLWRKTYARGEGLSAQREFQFELVCNQINEQLKELRQKLKDEHLAVVRQRLVTNKLAGVNPANL